MKKIWSLLSLFFIFSPLVASAHVKWFAESVGTDRPYQFTDMPVIIWIIVSLCLVFLGAFLEKKFHVPLWFHVHVAKLTPAVLSLASIGFGLAFLLFSINGFIFAPNLPAVGTTGLFLIAIQTIAGAMILFGFYERVGGLLILFLFALGIKEYGAFEMIDTLEMLGMAMYATIIGRPKWRIVEASWIKSMVGQLESYAVPLLRVGVGLNLIVLAFTEKILAPELTQNFLAGHNWNFMQNLGFHFFTDYWFAFSAGVAEALIGIFLVFGFVTRLTTLVLAMFLITTLVLLGPIELVGHLPHFSIAVVLLALGAGSRLKLLKADW